MVSSIFKYHHPPEDKKKIKKVSPTASYQVRGTDYVLVVVLIASFSCEIFHEQRKSRDRELAKFDGQGVDEYKKLKSGDAEPCNEEEKKRHM